MFQSDLAACFRVSLQGVLRVLTAYLERLQNTFKGSRSLFEVSTASFGSPRIEFWDSSTFWGPANGISQRRSKTFNLLLKEVTTVEWKLLKPVGNASFVDA